MPNLPAHIDLAHRAAQCLGHSTVEANVGYFFLGSTTPDIRAMTGRSREEYHFTGLDFDGIGSGVSGMFESHPDLRVSTRHDGPTQAFVAGYVTHLIADEIWIMDMYRPYFGDRAVFPDAAFGLVMDRAMQLELDRQSWGAVETAMARVGEATGDVSIGFISEGTLAAWRQRVMKSLGRGFDWGRLRSMAGRIAGGDEAHPAHRIAGEFIETMPDSLEELYRLVPALRVTGFRERTVRALVDALREYLP